MESVVKFILSYLTPIFSGQTWKDKRKERYYRVLSVGKNYVICEKMFFHTKCCFGKKDFRRGLYLIV